MTPEWNPGDSEMLLLQKMLWRLGSIDEKLGATPQQTMSTQVEVTNFPATQTVNGSLTVSGAVSVSGQVSVDNFPAFPSSFAVSNFPSNFAVNNFPASFAISNFPPFPPDFAVNNFPASFAVSNFPASFAVNNFPATQPVSGAVTVSGAVSVSNFPATQPISGTVAVSNFPATQPVSIAGTVPVSAAALPLPAGASTEATLASILAKFSTNYGKTVNFFAIAQGAVGSTTIAAASPGNRHKVMGFLVTSASNGTAQFFSNAAAITGAMDILARGNITMPANPLTVIFQTSVNEALNITSTGGAAKGFVAFLTEP